MHWIRLVVLRRFMPSICQIVVSKAHLSGVVVVVVVLVVVVVVVVVVIVVVIVIIQMWAIPGLL